MKKHPGFKEFSDAFLPIRSVFRVDVDALGRQYKIQYRKPELNTPEGIKLLHLKFTEKLAKSPFRDHILCGIQGDQVILQWV